MWFLQAMAAHKKLRTMEINEAPPDIYNEVYINDF